MIRPVTTDESLRASFGAAVFGTQMALLWHGIYYLAHTACVNATVHWDKVYKLQGEESPLRLGNFDLSILTLLLLLPMLAVLLADARRTYGFVETNFKAAHFACLILGAWMLLPILRPIDEFLVEWVGVALGGVLLTAIVQLGTVKMPWKVRFGLGAALSGTAHLIVLFWSTPHHYMITWTSNFELVLLPSLAIGIGTVAYGLLAYRSVGTTQPIAPTSTTD